jgi:hypothetical protein
MKSNIVILGSGVAALSCAYHLLDTGYAVTIVSPDSEFNIKLGGVRFLHDHASDPFHALLHNMGVTKKIRELSGGIHILHDDLDKFYDWSYLLQNRSHCEELTRLYASSTGRSWSEKIMNKVLLADTPPVGLVSPSYADLVTFMVNQVTNNDLFTYKSMQIRSIDRCSQTIKDIKGKGIDYSLLINTIPFWVFKDLFEVYMPVRRKFIFSEPRYASTKKVYGAEDEFSMTYYAGNAVLDVLQVPLKRVSVVDNYSIHEYHTKPQNDIKHLSTLPPNIVDTPLDDWNEVLDTLKSENIRLLGRFAQLKSKMMFTDIIDESYSLIEDL